jgi:hypothetical protein
MPLASAPMRFKARFRAVAVRHASVRPGFRGRAGHGRGAAPRLKQAAPLRPLPDAVTGLRASQLGARSLQEDIAALSIRGGLTRGESARGAHSAHPESPVTATQAGAAEDRSPGRRPARSR